MFLPDYSPHHFRRTRDFWRSTGGGSACSGAPVRGSIPGNGANEGKLVTPTTNSLVLAHRGDISYASLISKNQDLVQIVQKSYKFYQQISFGSTEIALILLSSRILVRKYRDLAAMQCSEASVSFFLIICNLIILIKNLQKVCFFNLTRIYRVFQQFSNFFLE